MVIKSTVLGTAGAPRAALVLISPFLLILPSSIAAHEVATVSASAELLAVGEEYQPCVDCPTFVRVPQARDDLRPIRYVSKFEFTWNEYIEAVDAGACPAPRKEYIGGTDPQETAPYLENLRIDWAIGHLGVEEVACYASWLQERTSFTVSLPTSYEWLWFARGDNQDAKFPWGDDPDLGQGALAGQGISLDDQYPGFGYEAGGVLLRVFPLAFMDQIRGVCMI